MIGNIPKKLKYFSKPLVEIKTEYDDFEIAIGGTQMVKPTFVSDAENEKTCESGKAWAEDNYVYDKDTKKWVKNPDYTVESFDNDKITNVKVVSLEKRSQGGRAYKIIIDDVYYVDLREDILLDTILNSGIDAGGKLRGEFIWAKVGSAMKLIRHGSALHEELIKSTEMSILNKIKTLVPGRIYESKTEKLLYIGKVKYYGVNHSTQITTHQMNTAVFKKELRNDHLFYAVYSEIKDVNEIFSTDFVHRYKFKKTHSLKIDTGKTIPLPFDVIEKIKLTAEKAAKKYFNDHYKGKNFYWKFEDKTYEHLNYLHYVSSDTLSLMNLGEKMNPDIEILTSVGNLKLTCSA